MNKQNLRKKSEKNISSIDPEFLGPEQEWEDKTKKNIL
jgi:hypothetical protein